jgi:hypothetical protein
MDDVTASPSSTESPKGSTTSSPRSGILPTALTRRGKERFSGTLRLDGGPGGRVIMRDGQIIAASTPVAPGIESLLLRSGRIAESDWREVFDSAAPYGRLAGELVERGLLGAATVEVLTQTAVFDAIFAIALYGVRSSTAEPAAEGDLPPLLPVEPGLDADRVVRETARRLEIAAGWRRFGLTIDSRPDRLSAEHGSATAPARREILEEVNGRSTARDIAFSLGRGLYSVMTDLAVLINDGLITIDPLAAERPQVGGPRLDEISPDRVPIDELLSEPDPPADVTPEPLPKRRRRIGIRKPKDAG